MPKWRECKLGDIIELIGGGTPKTSVSKYWNGDIPWLSVVDFNTGNKFVYTTEKSITKAGLENSSTKILDPGDIIVSARGTVGAMAVLKKPMAFNQSCYGVRNVEGVSDKDYLYYLLKDSVGNLQQIAHGGVFDTITRETFDSIDVSLPPLSEQRAIAAVLSSLDDKIDLLHRQNKTLESLASTLWRKMFIEDAKPDWETTTIGKVAQINARSVDKNYKNDEIEYLDTGSITEGKSSGYQRLLLSDAPSRARRIVQENDIVISMVRPVQKHYGILKGVKSNTVVSTGFVVVSCDKIDPYFIYLLLTQKEMTEYLDVIAEASTSTYPSLNPSDISEIDFQIPPAESLQEFSDKAGNIWQKIYQNNSQIDEIVRLRDLLLPKLMVGEVEA